MNTRRELKMILDEAGVTLEGVSKTKTKDERTMDDLVERAYDDIARRFSDDLQEISSMILI